MIATNEILSILRRNKSVILDFGVSEIGLFGSYAREEQTENSDIDLLIDFKPEKENFDNYMAVYDFCKGLFQNRKVEIVTKNGLSKYIGSKILNSVKYV